ncbi:hypothetical protein V1505DRAFT_416812 [Lipomyces doorenjongii]
MHLQIGDKFADKQAFMFAMKDIAITEGYQYYNPCSDRARHIVIPAIPANSDEYEVRTKGGEIFLCRWDYCGTFVEDHFKVDAFERTYAQEIHAMSTVNVTNDDTLPKVGLPNTRRPPGRPHKKWNTTEDIGIPTVLGALGRRVMTGCGPVANVSCVK